MAGEYECNLKRDADFCGFRLLNMEEEHQKLFEGNGKAGLETGYSTKLQGDHYKAGQVAPYKATHLPILGARVTPIRPVF